jgi:hypothetical protein
MTLPGSTFSGFVTSPRRLATRLRCAGWGGNRVERCLIDLLLSPADIRQIRRQHSTVFGCPPRLVRPRTFNDKIQRFKISRRRQHYTRLVDKLAVREFVRDRIGSQVLARVLWTGSDLEEARRLSLPKKFVVKANHGSGWNLLVTDASVLDWEVAKVYSELA